MYTEMVGKRGYSLQHFVDMVSTNAAKIMGLYPRKGAIAAGADADICMLDPALKRQVRAEALHETDYTPWEGRQVDAWPAMTILRGKIMVEGDTWLGGMQDGQWQHRTIPRTSAPAPPCDAARTARPAGRCLALWEVPGRVSLAGGGVALIAPDGTRLRVYAAAADDRPVRWWLERPGPEPALHLRCSGLLRTLRNAVGAGEGEARRLRGGAADA